MKFFKNEHGYFFMFILGLYLFSTIVISNLDKGSLITKILGVLFCIVSIYSVLKNKKPFLKKEIVAVWLFFLWCSIGLAFGTFKYIDVLHLFSKYITLFQLLLMFTLLLLNIDSDQLFYYIVFVVACSTLIASVLPFFINHGSYINHRIAGFSGNANGYGRVALFGMIAFVILICTKRLRTFKIIFISAIFVLFYCILRSGSRQCLLGSVLFFGSLYLYFFFNYLRKKFLTVSLISILLIIVMVVGAFFVKEMNIFDRFRRVAEWSLSGDIVGEQSVTGRVYLIQSALNKFPDNPIAGIGIGHATDVLGIVTHNNYTEVLLTTGLVGFVLYYSVYFILFAKLSFLKRKLKKNKSVNEKTIFFVVWITFFVFLLLELFSVSYMEKNHWLWMALMIGYSNQKNKQYA
ncbi:MAG: O-antigen ligase family protein [Salinivirgaceae bacterium]|nr:O-antigen ligase family protein [Salinivirgaceae bacterium]